MTTAAIVQRVWNYCSTFEINMQEFNLPAVIWIVDRQGRFIKFKITKNKEVHFGALSIKQIDFSQRNSM